MITIPSTHKTNLSQTLPYESNNDNLRDASFSSYLNGEEESFVRKLAESGQHLSPTIAAQEDQLYLGKKKEADEEIEVFGAEKYFKGAMDDSPRLAKVGTRKYQYIKDEEIKVAPVKTQAQHGTPSVRSESSWNSQSALLQSALRNSSRRQTNKVHGKKFLAALRCKCSCTDKDSVDIDEHIVETGLKRSADCNINQSKAIPKETTRPIHLIDKIQIDKPGLAEGDLGLKKENCFSFPIMDSTTGNIPIKSHFEEEKEETIKPRQSLEVFRCPLLETRDKSLSLERRLSMLSWDATRRLEENELSATTGENYTDAASDASSDLFEIESLTGKVNPFLARQGSDATSDCVTPTAGYAPSEASIEWSVVTASAADVSMMSDWEELRAATRATSPVKTFSATSNAQIRTITEIPKQRPSISLGCKSHKAVRVAGDAYRIIEKANYDTRVHRLSDSLTPLSRFQAEAKLTGLDSIQRQQPLVPAHSLPRSHSPRPSHLLYIQ